MLDPITGNLPPDIDAVRVESVIGTDEDDYITGLAESADADAPEK